MTIINRDGALEKEETTKLATYNSEVARGLVHTPEWVSYMAHLQKRFNQENDRWALAHGGIRMEGGGWMFVSGLRKCDDRICRCRSM